MKILAVLYLFCNTSTPVLVSQWTKKVQRGYHLDNNFDQSKLNFDRDKIFLLLNRSLVIGIKKNIVRNWIPPRRSLVWSILTNFLTRVAIGMDITGTLRQGLTDTTIFESFSSIGLDTHSMINKFRLISCRINMPKWSTQSAEYDSCTPSSR